MARKEACPRDTSEIRVDSAHDTLTSVREVSASRTETLRSRSHRTGKFARASRPRGRSDAGV